MKYVEVAICISLPNACCAKTAALLLLSFAVDFQKFSVLRSQRFAEPLHCASWAADGQLLSLHIGDSSGPAHPLSNVHLNPLGMISPHAIYNFTIKTAPKVHNSFFWIFSGYVHRDTFKRRLDRLVSRRSCSCDSATLPESRTPRGGPVLLTPGFMCYSRQWIAFTSGCSTQMHQNALVLLQGLMSINDPPSAASDILGPFFEG